MHPLQALSPPVLIIHAHPSASAYPGPSPPPAERSPPTAAVALSLSLSPPLQIDLRPPLARFPPTMPTDTALPLSLDLEDFKVYVTPSCSLRFHSDSDSLRRDELSPVWYRGTSRSMRCSGA
ncbi:hypothetical protein PVAP13_5KG216714 [Panicum virgatum]|uniref:Uncharacterized protein n=1 Tax=Panicum virgatum TaxID=38727 RepID=A0A8T0SIT5_PANVG|nr:hypothetical protein PVAP13_5KG216714 [Panicum virgatum]